MNWLCAMLFGPEVLRSTNPPLFYLLAWGMGRVGLAEAWLRLPSLGFGLLAVALTRRLALELGATRGEALLAAGLLACSPLAIGYSADFSPYSLVTALAALSTWLLLRCLRGRRRGPWIAYLAVSLAGFYTHYVFVPVLLSHLAFVAVFGWRQRASGGLATVGRFLSRGALAGLLALPWLPVMLTCLVLGGLLKDTTRHHYLPAPGFGPYALQAVRVLAGLPPWALALVVVPVALWVCGLRLQAARHRDALALLLALPAAMLLQVGSSYRMMAHYLGGNTYYPFRYTLPLLPILVVPVAMALCALVRAALRPGRAPWHRGAAAVALAMVLISGGAVASWDVQILRAMERPDLRAACGIAAEELRDGDALVVLPAYSQAGAFGWYLLGSMDLDLVDPQWRPLPASDPGWFYGPVADLAHSPLQERVVRGDFARVVVISIEEALGGVPRFDHERVLTDTLRTLEDTYRVERVRVLPHLRVLVLAQRQPTVLPPLEDLLRRPVGGGG